MKMVLTVTLEHGQEQTESAQFMVRDVTDETDTSRPLQKPWRVSWAKTPAHWRYPLRYVQDVNNKPTERIIQVGWTQCSDNPLNVDEELTCGVARVGGVKAPDSEGFCCGCDAADITGGLPTRGSLECSAFSMSESAHCLGFDDLWYSVFEVSRPQIAYDIIVSLAKPDDPEASWQNVTYHEERLTLSHQQPVAEAGDGALRLQLVGDLATAVAPHRFESKYLVVPSRPSGHPRVDDKLPMKYAMLVDRSMFDLSGLTCDKIGVSFTAFKRQTEKCESPAGSCLARQLDDLYKEDMARVDAGGQPRYLVSSFSEGAVQLGSQREGASGTTHFLACPLQQRHTTMMRLEARAEEVMFVTNVASGRVVTAEAPAFEALQGGGEVKVIVVSTGRVVADFTVGLANCSTELTAAPAVTISLQPYETSEQNIKLLAQQTGGGKFACTATLHNAVGALIDTKAVEVNVTDLQFTSGAQVDVERAGAVAEGGEIADGGSCSTVCPSFFDIGCFLVHSCWDRFARVAVMVAILVVLLLCCCWAAKNGMLRKCLYCLCSPGCSFSSSSPKQSTNVHVHMPRSLAAPAPAPIPAPSIQSAAAAAPPSLLHPTHFAAASKWPAPAQLGPAPQHHGAMAGGRHPVVRRDAGPSLEEDFQL